VRPEPPSSAADTSSTGFFSGPSFSVATTNMSGGGATEGSLLYGFIIPDQGGYDAAGNLLNVTDSVMGLWSYGYDNLNRLATGSAGTSSAAGVSNTFANVQAVWSYDPFGNRTGSNWTYSGPGNRPNAPSNVTANYTVGTNQVSGYSYDQAGNVLNDGQNQYLYDAEGRLCAVENLSGPTVITGYVYDAAGTRVARGTLSSFSCNFAPSNFTATTSWVLGPGGEQVTEYSTSGLTYTGAQCTSTSPTCFVHTNAFASGQLLATYVGAGTDFALNDWLGTKRVEVSANGGCVVTYASMPFGDGLPYTSVGDCPLDATEHHFTGKERDTESGNDYFGARYYASTMGRFMSPDPIFAEANRVLDPQQWNMYAYARNNPLSITDPTGMDFNLGCSGSSLTCQGGKQGMYQFDKDGRVAHPKEALKKFLFLQRLPSGAKARHSFCCVCGTTKAVPFQSLDLIRGSLSVSES
jgi:RHS repeat-associated protein